MDEKQKLLRHFLAALAYRTQKALRHAPEDFGSDLNYRTGSGSDLADSAESNQRFGKIGIALPNVYVLTLFSGIRRNAQIAAI